MWLFSILFLPIRIDVNELARLAAGKLYDQLRRPVRGTLEILDINTAFKPIAGIGPQVECFAGPADIGRAEAGAFQENF